MSIRRLTAIVRALALGASLLAASSTDARTVDGLAFQLRDPGSYLGLAIAEITPEKAKALGLGDTSGIEVVAVQQGEAGEAAGVRPRDLIISYNGEKILSAQQFLRLVQETPPGRRIKLVCLRNSTRQEVWVTTGSRTSGQGSVDLLPGGSVMDVPFPMMMWRNLILGIESEDLNDQMLQALGVKQGILVWAVATGSPAERAGLRSADVLTGFCGRLIHSPRDLSAVLHQLPAGEDALTLNVVRDHKQMSLHLLLDLNR